MYDEVPSSDENGAQMNIYFYDLGLNETFYAQYLIKGFKQNGHNVLVKPRGAVAVENEAILLRQNDVDLIVFMGFSFVNHLRTNPDDFLPTLAGIPFITMWYDDPRRYDLPLAPDLLDHMFICCDSNLALKMSDLGYKSYYLPCTFDPEIQYLRGKDPRFMHPVAFAGSVFNGATILSMRNGLSILDIEFIDDLFKKRTPGKYFDYMLPIARHMNKEPIKDAKFYARLDQIIICVLLQQKHYLRMDMIYTLYGVGLAIYGQGDYTGEHEPWVTRFLEAPEPDKKRVGKNLNQHTELPALYASCEINLTIELLPASVHQRIFECFACGGFMLCEEKADMYICFPADLVDRVTWHTLEELKEMTTYFLKNAEERAEISTLFQKELKKRHTAKIRTKEIISLWEARQV